MSAHRSPPRGERGALLPLLALVLAVGGASWAMTVSVEPGDGGGDRALAARARLLDARLALIAHASAYPESYGPLGAGPGHLVCPDADTPLERPSRPSTARSDGAFGGDGPNPPCGGGPLAVGRLPRHASPDGRRRAFHHESVQRFVYGVSTGHVNNPPGHAVRGASAGGSGVAAVIVDPGGVALSSVALGGARDPLEVLRLARAMVAREAGANAARALPHAFVTRSELSDAAERRVLAWFVESATESARRRAAAASAGSGTASGIPAVWPVADCPDGAPHASLRWVGDDTDDVCAAPATIEGVPRERHWFFRGDWFRDIAVRRAAACLDEAPVACRLDVARGGEARRDGALTADARAGVPSLRLEPVARVSGPSVGGSSGSDSSGSGERAPRQPNRPSIAGRRP